MNHETVNRILRGRRTTTSRRKVPTLSQVLSSIQEATFASERPHVPKTGRQTFLPWAPSNLVTYLLTYKCCYSFSNAAERFNQGY